MKHIFSLFIVLWSITAWGQEGEGGFNPSNPAEPGQRYDLTIQVIPDGAGSTSPQGKQQYALGETVRLNAYPNNGYLFIGWEENGDTISRERYFDFTIPARNTTLNAVFRTIDDFNPDNPDEPSQEAVKYGLTLAASPAEGGRFNLSAETTYSAGKEVTLYAYPNSNFQFEGWKQGDRLLSAESPYTFTMGKEDVHITGVFRFNPANPGNPGANHWNAETGELIVDDFIPGRIMDAVDQVIGGSGNRSKVSMIIASGQMQSYDLGVADYMSNCALLDLSRTGGYTQIPNYAFDKTNLTTIILPAGIEEIGNYAFANSQNLTEITCYALTPPKVDRNTFTDIAEGVVIHVLASAIPLYAEAEGWKDFTLLPLTEDVRSLEVSLPAGSEGVYKNMTLELQNQQNGQKQRYVVSDRLSYTFNGLLKNCTYHVYLKTSTDVILGKIENIEIKEEDLSVSFNSLLALLNVNVKVQTPDKTDVSEQVQVTWLDSKKAYLSQGNQLKGQTTGTELIYRIALNQDLGMQYAAPEDQTFSVQNQDTVLTYTLTPLQTVTISGQVKDANGSALTGATVSVSQKLNGKYSKSFIGQTDAKGQFSMQVFNDQSTIAISATDCISQTLEMTNFNDSTDLGIIQLKDIDGATINLNLTYTPSVTAGMEATTEDWYSDYANVAYSIYNETRQKEIANFVVQYPAIVLLDEVAEGDKLKLTASSKNNAFEPVTATATIDASLEATVTFPIIGLGGIEAVYQTTDNTAVTAMLYDSKGELLKKYSYNNSALSIPDLASGSYTLVSMSSSDFFNSILKLSALETSGLTEGTDYIKNEVTVKSGVISQVSNESIPTLDESKLYYTGDNTSFTVNKASIVAGNYLTLKGLIDFKSEYAAEVSNVQLLVDLPESCSFVENSVMVGSQISGYTIDGNRLTIALNNYNEQVRFCVIPTKSGDFQPNAFVKFSINRNEIVQPIGSAHCSIKDLSISVPEIVAKKTVTINGTSIGKSDIQIFDNNILIGQTSSLANGLWLITCELSNPTNLSDHEIFAKMITDDGIELQTEKKSVFYNENAIKVSKVTMINMAHGSKDTKLLEYVTIFDFIYPQNSAQTYWYWPSYPEFTFKIDFTNNDPGVVSNVALHVKTSSDKIVRIPASYYKEKDTWVATQDFHSGSLPVNVSVTFDYLDYTPCDSLHYVNTLEQDFGFPDVENYNEEEGIVTYIMKSSVNDMAMNCFYFKTDIKNKDFFFNNNAKSDFKLDNENAPFKYYISQTDAYLLTKETKDSLYAYAYFDVNDYQAYADYVGLFGKDIGVNTRIAGFNPGADQIAPSTDRLNQWRDHMIQGVIDEANRKLKCADDATNITLHNAVMKVRQSVGFSIGSFLAHSANLINTAGGRPKNALDAGKKLWDSADAASSFGDGMEGLTRAGQFYLKQIHDAPDCPGDDGNKGNNSGDSGNPNSGFVMDPSGYVYEAVESNRLPGVTATCYYKEMVEDMYGDLHEQVVLWDAAEYAQENPLFTDENGMYRWDVPQGLWQVKFEKEGYQTTYSEWLPVPPPQLEVNIGMVQTAQPNVAAVRGYETGIEVDFSKFMLPETMTSEFISITRNGEAVSGEVIFKNAEANPLDKNTQYVSKVRFVPAEALATTDKVILTVSKRVKSYAGIQMENDYSQEIPIEKEPKAVMAEEIEVVYNGTAELTVAIDPAETAAGKKVTALSASSVIASIDPAEATLNEEGKAVFTITGELPGQTMIQFTVENTDIRPEVKVNVVEAGAENITQRYTLATGWNWISVNVQAGNLNDLPTLLAPIKEATLTVKGAGSQLVNNGENGWEGELNSLTPTQAYKIKMQKDAVLELNGKAAVANGNTITLAKGWNWIGYVSTVSQTLEDALQNLQAETNDVIKGEDSFAVYDGTAWKGSLHTLTPGKGYMYCSQAVKSFNYATGSETMESEPAIPQWDYDAHLSEDNMVIVAQLYNGEQPVNEGTYIIGIFAGDECRGVALEEDGRLYICAHGGQEDGKLSLRAYDIAGQKEYDIQEKIAWSSALTGTPEEPLKLHIGELTGIIPVYEGVLIYPSPVRDRLYIRGDIAPIAEARITNMAGQTIMVEKNVQPLQGLDVSTLEEGFYFISLLTDQGLVKQKFMKKR